MSKKTQTRELVKMLASILEGGDARSIFALVTLELKDGSMPEVYSSVTNLPLLCDLLRRTAATVEEQGEASDYFDVPVGGNS